MAEIPYTNASSDFLKKVNFPSNEKSNLIDYSATDFASLRESLIKYIKAVYPLDYNSFEESDYGMMFTELVAYMGAVMSLKADMLANESFILTAKDRNNVKKLFELIGVRMKGPISAAAQASVELPTGTVTTAGESVVINAEDRVISVVSNEDGAPVNYTLYTITNGLIDQPNEDSNISLVHERSNDANGQIWENVVLLEGAFAVETGRFNQLSELKEIALSESPVVEGSVQVYIDSDSLDSSGAYSEVENLFFASGLDDKIFSIVYDQNYAAKVVFGDGSNGITPPTNSTYTITYRVGGGTRGNAPTSYINTAVPGTLNSTEYSLSVQNTNMFTGGSDAETVEHAKKYAPLYFKTQDRLVTSDDYIAFTNRFVSTTGSTAKATAAVRKAFCSANIIDIFVLEKASTTQLQKASVSFKQELLSAMNAKKMLTDELVAVDGLIRSIDLIVTVNVDSKFKPREGEIKRKASQAILEYFNVDNREFGEIVRLEEINRAVFELPEIRYATVDNIDSNIVLQFNEIIQLNNLTINVTYI